MNTLEYFAKLEAADMLRADSNEGISHLLRGEGAILQIMTEEKFVPVGEIRGPIRYHPDALKKVNIFCMYALRESPLATLVDPANLRFGDTFALLTDFDEFLERVRTAAAKIDGQELKQGLVEYIDYGSYLGPVGVFKKPLAFSYQSEFRLALFPGTGAPIQFQVGVLSDIVILGPLSELNGRLRIFGASPPGTQI